MPLMPLLWLLVWLGAIIVVAMLYGAWLGRKERARRRRKLYQTSTFRWGDRER